MGRRLEDGYYWVEARCNYWVKTRFSTELTVGKYTRREVDDPWYEFPWQLIGTDELFTEREIMVVSTVREAEIPNTYVTISEIQERLDQTGTKDTEDIIAKYPGLIDDASKMLDFNVTWVDSLNRQEGRGIAMTNEELADEMEDIDHRADRIRFIERIKKEAVEEYISRATEIITENTPIDVATEALIAKARFIDRYTDRLKADRVKGMSNE